VVSKNHLTKGADVAHNGNSRLSKQGMEKMTTYHATCTDRIRQEVAQTPDEYLPLLLEMIHLFRQSVALKPAEESFRQGWQETLRGKTLPVSEL
jgi:hypothetical protein